MLRTVTLLFLVHSVSSNDKMLSKIKPDLDLLKDVSNETDQLIRIYFKEVHCIELHTDGSGFADSLLGSIFTARNLPSVKISRASETCIGHAILALDLSRALGILRLLSKWSEQTILILVNEPQRLAVDTFVRDPFFYQDAIGDSQILIVRYKNMHYGYFIGQPDRTFSYVQLDSIDFHALQHKVVMDFQGRSIIAATFDCPFFSRIGDVNEQGQPVDPDLLSGSDMSLFLDITNRLNLTRVFRLVSNTEKISALAPEEKWHFRELDKDGTNGDIAFCGLVISPQFRSEHIVMSEPVTSVCIKFLVPRPTPVPTEWDSLFKAFRFDLWATIALTVGLISFILQKIALSVKSYKRDARVTNFTHLGSSFLQIVSILVMTGIPKSEEAQGAVRHLITWWATFGMLLSAVFSSGLIYNLTTQRYTEKVNSVQEIIDNEFQWPVLKIPDLHELITQDTGDSNNTDSLNQWRLKKRVKIMNNVTQLRNYMKKKKTIFWGGRIERGFYVPDALPEDILSEYEITSKCFIEYYMGFALVKGSPFRKSISRYIRTYKEAGLVDQVIHRAIFNESKTHPSILEVLKGTREKMASVGGLTMKHLSGIFRVWAIGLGVAVVVFFLEYLQMFRI